MRRKILFNSGWKFIKENVGIAKIRDVRGALINLPHTWNAVDGQDGGNDYSKIGAVCEGSNFGGNIAGAGCGASEAERWNEAIERFGAEKSTGVPKNCADGGCFDKGGRRNSRKGRPMQGTDCHLSGKTVDGYGWKTDSGTCGCAFLRE